jgi:hypothetical protein
MQYAGHDEKDLAARKGGLMTRLDHEKDRRNHLPKDVPRDPINDAPRPRHPRERRHPILGDIAKRTRDLDVRIGLSSPDELKNAIAGLVALIKAFYAEKGRGATEIANARTVIERANDKITRARPAAPKHLPGSGPYRAWKVKAKPRPTRTRSRRNKGQRTKKRKSS